MAVLRPGQLLLTACTAPVVRRAQIRHVSRKSMRLPSLPKEGQYISEAVIMGMVAGRKARPAANTVKPEPGQKKQPELSEDKVLAVKEELSHLEGQGNNRNVSYIFRKAERLPDRDIRKTLAAYVVAIIHSLRQTLGGIDDTQSLKKRTEQAASIQRNLLKHKQKLCSLWTALNLLNFDRIAVNSEPAVSFVIPRGLFGRCRSLENMALPDVELTSDVPAIYERRLPLLLTHVLAQDGYFLDYKVKLDKLAIVDITAHPFGNPEDTEVVTVRVLSLPRNAAVAALEKVFNVVHSWPLYTSVSREFRAMYRLLDEAIEERGEVGLSLIRKRRGIGWHLVVTEYFAHLLQHSTSPNEPRAFLQEIALAGTEVPVWVVLQMGDIIVTHRNEYAEDLLTILRTFKLVKRGMQKSTSLLLRKYLNHLTFISSCAGVAASGVPILVTVKDSGKMLFQRTPVFEGMQQRLVLLNYPRGTVLALLSDTGTHLQILPFSPFVEISLGTKTCTVQVVEHIRSARSRSIYIEMGLEMPSYSQLECLLPNGLTSTQLTNAVYFLEGKKSYLESVDTSKTDLSGLLGEINSSLSIDSLTLTQGQMLAVIRSILNGVVVVKGSAGSGKSYLVPVIVSTWLALKSPPNRILVLADVVSLSSTASRIRAAVGNVAQVVILDGGKENAIRRGHVVVSSPDNVALVEHAFGFTHVIVDDANSMTETHLIRALVVGPNMKRVVFLTDPSVNKDVEGSFLDMAKAKYVEVPLTEDLRMPPGLSHFVKTYYHKQKNITGSLSGGTRQEIKGLPSLDGVDACMVDARSVSEPDLTALVAWLVTEVSKMNPGTEVLVVTNLLMKNLLEQCESIKSCKYPITIAIPETLTSSTEADLVLLTHLHYEPTVSQLERRGEQNLIDWMDYMATTRSRGKLVYFETEGQDRVLRDWRRWVKKNGKVATLERFLRGNAFKQNPLKKGGKPMKPVFDLPYSDLTSPFCRGVAIPANLPRISN